MVFTLNGWSERARGRERVEITIFDNPGVPECPIGQSDQLTAFSSDIAIDQIKGFEIFLGNGYIIVLM
jgi:hypothetical protein